MDKYFRTKKQKVVFIFLIFAIILVGRLFVLTVIQNDKWDGYSNNFSLRGIYNPSPRGNIYDRNGNLLAGNKQIFTVKMSAGDSTNEELNNTSYKLINILEKDKEDYTDDFPIKISVDGKSYYYTYDVEIKNWLKENDFNTNLTAEEAFNALRNKLGISADLDRYDAQSEMQNKYNVYPPISTKTMTYTYTNDKKQFLKNYNLEEDLSAKKAFGLIKEKFEINESISDSNARKIMIIRDELKSLGYKKYMPASISKNVSNTTVVKLEENENELEGVEVISETERYYPNKNTASHILGYMGKISASQEDEYAEKGYDKSALIGKEGIEKVFENDLKGQDGTKIIRVDAQGNLVETLNTIEPKKGKDVYLTIDLDLQKVAEDALERTITSARTGSTFKSEFGDITPYKTGSNAGSGATVAIDVKTGDVLAMASYPDYDPNLFTDGISTKNWNSLQSENVRDSMSPAPLFNIATRTAVQPGSTFKPITAATALDAGLNATKKLYADGFIKIGNRTFGCVLWNFYHRKHGYIDLYRAMEVSCNYYFYDIGTGKDWFTGEDLGYTKKITIDSIEKFAEQFGLGKATGIELPETVMPVPSEKRKIAGLQTNLKNVLYASAEQYFNEDVYSNSKRLEKDIDEITSWLELDDMTYDTLKNKYLASVGVKSSKLDDLTKLILYTYMDQAKWTVGDAFNISIGQGDNAFTPLQMANYVATIANGGVKNQVNVVKSVEDEGPTEKADSTKVTLSKSNLQVLVDAMKLDTQGEEGSLRSHYTNFPWVVAAKTGTAQRAGRINPPSEVAYIKEHLSSFGDMSWASVEKEMKRLMSKYPSTYTSEDTAVRKAVINISGDKVTYENLDRFKDTYDEFSWVIAFAPADDPQIAVATLVVQGATSSNADPCTREIIGQYLKENDSKYKEFDIKTDFN